MMDKWRSFCHDSDMVVYLGFAPAILILVLSSFVGICLIVAVT
jgi:hypothetical protein